MKNVTRSTILKTYSQHCVSVVSETYSIRISKEFTSEVLIVSSYRQLPNCRLSYLHTGILAIYLFRVWYALRIKTYFTISNYDWNCKRNHSYYQVKDNCSRIVGDSMGDRVTAQTHFLWNCVCAVTRWVTELLHRYIFFETVSVQ